MSIFLVFIRLIIVKEGVAYDVFTLKGSLEI